MLTWMATTGQASSVALALALAAAGVGSAVAHGPQRDADRTDEIREALVGGPARNVLLFIGDGMGDSEISLARYYSAGATGRLALDALPFTGVFTTSSVQESNPSLPDYVPDSAAAATAWATGVKTSNGRIATSAASDRDLPTILEHAAAQGWRTGLVTTTELTDATPAALAAHVAHRDCQGPADMARCPQDLRRNGGAGSIAEQLVSHEVDVLLGGGAVRFEQRTESGARVVEKAAEQGVQIVRTREELANADAGRRVLGLFSPGNLAIEWTGPRAVPYPANVLAPQSCRPAPRDVGEPTLVEMTAAALRMLGRPGGRGAGFFLQVEGGSIDKQDHLANPCGQIGETVGFDRAVRLGLDYAAEHPGTLVIVTADHGHASQIVGTPTDADHPSGVMSTLVTIDGAPLTVSYGTNVAGRDQGHTGTQVRVAAAGPQAANVLGVGDQRDLFHLLLRAMGAGTAASTRQSSGR